MQPSWIDGIAYLCQALTHVSGLEALLVLNPSTGKFLKHCQLQCDPRYKATWDTSYANELGWLCQGIGTGPSPNTKWVAGTNTFFLINYHDIPCHKGKEICHTMVVYKLCLENSDPDCTCMAIGGNCICFRGNVGTNTASLELVNLLLNSVLSCPGAGFSSIDLNLDTPMPDPESSALKSLTFWRNSLRSTTFKVTIVTGGSTSRFAKADMAFPRLAFLPTISSNPAFFLRDNTRTNPPQASGATNGFPSNSTSWLITLGWSMMG